MPTLRRPLLINWLITGRCPLACQYCYAEDLMRDDNIEPRREQLSTAVAAIAYYSPLAVVLTGGDPLFSPNLSHAIELLHGQTGLIVDTSAYTLRDDHIELFKNYSVAVRISIDSERPQVHNSQRPPSKLYQPFLRRGRTLEAALDGLCRCLEAGLTVGVQTVATKKTANDLLSLGDKLFRLGVRSWRVFKVSPSQLRMVQYRRLVGLTTDDGRAYRGKAARGPYEYAFKQVIEAQKQYWARQMSVQVTHNETPNSVILVSPDGRFMTESNTGSGKILLDPKNPRRPRLTCLLASVDMAGHAARYLNMTRSSTAE